MKAYNKISPTLLALGGFDFIASFLTSLLSRDEGRGLSDQMLVDMWNDTTSSNSGLDHDVKFFVTSDGQLKMSWGDSSNLEIFGGISSKFQNFGG